MWPWPRPFIWSSWTIGLTPDMPILCRHVQVYTLGRLTIDGFSFERVAQFNLECTFSNLYSGFQSLVGFRILSAGFRIPKPRIPESGFPYMGSMFQAFRKWGAVLYFSSLSLLRTALHYLNAWNRLLHGASCSSKWSYIIYGELHCDLASQDCSLRDDKRTRAPVCFSKIMRYCVAKMIELLWQISREKYFSWRIGPIYGNICICAFNTS